MCGAHKLQQAQVLAGWPVFGPIGRHFGRLRENLPAEAPKTAAVRQWWWSRKKIIALNGQFPVRSACRSNPPALPPGDERSAENSQAAGRDGRGESGGYQ